MTILNKALIVACIVLTLAVIYLGREQVMPAGPRNVMTMVRSPWTGRVYLCAPYGGECRQTYPPLDAPNGAAGDDAVNAAEVASDKGAGPPPDHLSSIVKALIARSRQAGASDDEIRAQMERSPYLADTWKKSDAAGIARADVFAHFGLKPSTAVDGRPDDGRKMPLDKSDKMKWCHELPEKVPNNGEIFKRLGFGPNQALVVNNGDTDAVAKFRNSLGAVVASIFIGRYSEAKIDNFPDGSYQLQFATGTGWSRRCGLFTENMHTKRFPDFDTFSIGVETKAMRGQEVATTRYKSWTYTITPVIDGNVQPETIDEDVFLRE